MIFRREKLRNTKSNNKIYMLLGSKRKRNTNFDREEIHIYVDFFPIKICISLSFTAQQHVDLVVGFCVSQFFSSKNHDKSVSLCDRANWMQTTFCGGALLYWVDANIEITMGSKLVSNFPFAAVFPQSPNLDFLQKYSFQSDFVIELDLHITLNYRPHQYLNNVFVINGFIFQ